MGLVSGRGLAVVLVLGAVAFVIWAAGDSLPSLMAIGSGGMGEGGVTSLFMAGLFLVVVGMMGVLYWALSGSGRYGGY